MSPTLSDLSSKDQLRISSISLKRQCKSRDEWNLIENSTTKNTRQQQLRMMIYNDSFNKNPPLSIFGLSPSCLVHVRDLRIEIPFLVPGQECQGMLSYLDALCLHLGEHLQSGAVHLKLEISYFNKGQYEQDILRVIGPLLHLPKMTSVRVTKKHDAPAAIKESCSATSRSEFKWFCQKTFAFLLTDLTPPTQEQPKRPFNFLELPVELQDLILSHSEIVSTDPIILPQSPLTRRPITSWSHRHCCYGCNPKHAVIKCSCNSSDNYANTCTCPTPLLSGLFLVNHRMHTQATETFYKHNTFAMEIRRRVNIVDELSTLPPKALRRVRKLEILLLTGRCLHSGTMETSAIGPLLSFFKDKLEKGALNIKIRLDKKWHDDGEKFEEMKAYVRASESEKYCQVEGFEHPA